MISLNDNKINFILKKTFVKMLKSIYIILLFILPIICYSQDNIILLKSGNFHFAKDLELVNSNDTNYYFLLLTLIQQVDFYQTPF